MEISYKTTLRVYFRFCHFSSVTVLIYILQLVFFIVLRNWLKQNRKTHRMFGRIRLGILFGEISYVFLQDTALLETIRYIQFFLI